MQNVKFNQCMNKQTKFYNFPAGFLIGLLSCGFLAAIIKGIIVGAIAGAIGGGIGAWIHHKWYLGILQRYLYWHFGINLSSKMPASYNRILM